MSTKQYTLIYRTGGKTSGKWHRTLVVGEYAHCKAKAIACETMGYPSLVLDAKDLAAIGLPEADEKDYNVFSFVPGMAAIMKR